MELELVKSGDMSDGGKWYAFIASGYKTLWMLVKDRDGDRTMEVTDDYMYLYFRVQSILA